MTRYYMQVWANEELIGETDPYELGDSTGAQQEQRYGILRDHQVGPTEVVFKVCKYVEPSGVTVGAE